MKQYTIDASDELVAQLEAYARERRQSPEATLVALAQEALTAAQSIAPTDTETATEDEDYPDPWAGFHGAFQTPYPDLTLRHDYYIGEAALDPHKPHEEMASGVSNDDQQ